VLSVVELIVVIMSVLKLNETMLGIIMLRFYILSVTELSFVMRNAILTKVKAPHPKQNEREQMFPKT